MASFRADKDAGIDEIAFCLPDINFQLLFNGKCRFLNILGRKRKRKIYRNNDFKKCRR